MTRAAGARTENSSVARLGAALVVCVVGACDGSGVAGAGDAPPASAPEELGPACPLVKVTCGDEAVEVQSEVTCAASGAVAAAASDNADAWRWHVEQPIGSLSQVVIHGATATFEANVVGHYAVSVEPAQQPEGCGSATFALTATTSDAIHVELLWRTPGDINETDTGMTLGGESVGSDLDLHVARGDADWFERRWDTSWLETNPDWGGYGSHDDPSLDRDDVDGGGPENFNLAVPEATHYRIGVHYWNHWGNGDAYATVRVYLEGHLVFEQADVLLVDHDLWEVGFIDWAHRRVTGLGPEPHITTSYPVPLDSAFLY